MSVGFVEVNHGFGEVEFFSGKARIWLKYTENIIIYYQFNRKIFLFIKG